jgi:hypothetical protein
MKGLSNETNMSIILLGKSFLDSCRLEYRKLLERIILKRSSKRDILSGMWAGLNWLGNISFRSFEISDIEGLVTFYK